MKTKRWMVLLMVVLAVAVGACGGDSGGGDGAAGGSGDERTVLVDHKHDQFASAFLRYYPENITVRPGDSVRFKQAWTGEPHSVTAGVVVDELFTNQELLMKYDSPEEALADGVTQAKIDEVMASLGRIPGMTGDGYEVYQPGARPCYIEAEADVPRYLDPMTEEIDQGAACPEGGEVKPPFTGTQGLYNSGFIAPEGDDANEFVLPIAEDAEPGTYRYYCNYHWTDMSGTIEIVATDEDIPSQDEVNRQARKEIEEDAEVALQKIEEAEDAATVESSVGELELPLAGRETDDSYTVVINEFLPKKIEAEVNVPVTWTFDGISHTVSFNVPKYFPVFTVEDDGEVIWNPQAYEPVGWEVPERPGTAEDEGEGDGEGRPEPRRVDVGKWDGKGGFRSSGALDPGDTFTLTFTKAGTFSYACVLHPQMVGTVTVKA